MTATLTTTPTSDTINPPAAPRCGLNETEICCKESETAHFQVLLARMSPMSPMAPATGAPSRVNMK
jgi:hypothetical protein